MADTCLYCYAPTGVYEVDYHASCARKFFKQYPPPLLPFTGKQLKDIGGSNTLYTIERKQRAAQQARLVPNDKGIYTLRSHIAKPLYLPAAESLCFKLAEAAGIKVVETSLMKDAEQDLVLALKLPKAPTPLLNIDAGKASASYEVLIKAIEKHCAQPGLTKVYMAERLVFAFLTGISAINRQTVELVNEDDNGWSLAPMAYCSPQALLQPALAIELDLLLVGKQSAINERTFDVFFEKIGINTKVGNTIKNTFSKTMRVWFEIVEDSFLPEHLKRSYIHILINRAEKLEIM
jgi:serine/threonine-protein kinase HipA